MPKDTTMRHPSTRKRMIWMLIGSAVLFGGVFGFKAVGSYFMNQFFDNMPQPPATITAAEVRSERWTRSLEAVGSLVAVNGTDVTTEVGGVVSAIRFESGQPVNKGDVLIELDTSTEQANLRALEAQARLAVAQRDRYQELFAGRQLVSKADLDTRVSEADSALAQVAAQKALIAKKTIRAPFSGLVGIRQVNLGQYLSPGDPIVGLQSLDPIFVNFSLPEQRLAEAREGLSVSASVDALPEVSFTGQITAIDSRVDANTRNFTVQATLDNPEHQLRPGTFARVSFEVGAPADVLVIPQTAVSFNPYGNSVYVIAQAPPAKDQKPAEGEAKAQSAAPQLVVNQRFVRTGATRGDLVEIVEGLKPGERVASSGLLKLRNGGAVVINNKVAPSAEEKPHPDNS